MKAGRRYSRDNRSKESDFSTWSPSPSISCFLSPLCPCVTALKTKWLFFSLSHINNRTQCSLVFKHWQWPSVTLAINNTHKREGPRVKEKKNSAYMCVCVCIRSIWMTCWHSALLLHFTGLFAYGAIYASISTESFLLALCLNRDRMSVLFFNTSVPALQTSVYGVLRWSFA